MSEPVTENAFTGLREMILGADPAALGLQPGPGGAQVWAALMEMGYDAATVSLVAVADGTTSLYFSTGGGIIGGGEHESVRTASRAFLEAVERALGTLAPAGELPLPELGRVRFNVLAFDGRRTAEAAETDLVGGDHPLSRLFHAGHAVIAELRRIEEPPGRMRD